MKRQILAGFGVDGPGDLSFAYYRGLNSYKYGLLVTVIL